MAFVFVAFVILVISLTLFGASQHQTYNAQIAQLSPINPGEVSVTVSITTPIGGSTLSPSCSINLSSPGGAYTGYTFISNFGSLAPGQSTEVTATVTITNSGAQYVTTESSSVTCS